MIARCIFWTKMFILLVSNYSLIIPLFKKRVKQQCSLSSVSSHPSLNSGSCALVVLFILGSLRSSASLHNILKSSSHLYFEIPLNVFYVIFWKTLLPFFSGSPYTKTFFTGLVFSLVNTHENKHVSRTTGMCCWVLMAGILKSRALLCEVWGMHWLEKSSIAWIVCARH